MLKTLVTTICLAAATVAFGESPATLEPIDEISVTVKRRPASLFEVSSAVSLVEAETIQASKLVTDALAENVGVFLQQTTPGQGTAIVRGLKGSAVLHLVDGMRLNNAIFRSAPTQYLALVPPMAVERIEVIRGTPTALYGNDAVGGVVEVVTRVPEFASDDTDYRGQLLARMESADLAQTLRATLDAGNQDLALSVSAGYQDTGNRRTGSGERIGPSDFESQSARLLLVTTPENAASWLIDLHYLEQPKTPRIDELVPGFGQTEPSSSEFFFAPNQRLFAHARRHNEAGLLELDWNLDVAWQRIVDDRVSRDLDAPVRRRESNRSDLYAISATAAGNNDGGGWIVGAEFDYDRVRSARSEETIADGSRRAVTSRFPDGASLRQAGLFGSADFRPAERQLLSAGLRFSSIEVDLPATPVSASATVNVDDFSGDLGWIYDISETLQVTANAGLGFRAPNVFDVGTLGNRSGNRFNIPNANLDSEQVIQVDLGLRYQGENWRAELVAYSLDYRDRITSVLTGDVTPGGRDVVQSVNAATATIHGIEAGLDIGFSDALTAALIVNYTRGKQRIGANNLEPADRIPPLNGSIELEYDPGGSWQYAGWLVFADRQERLSARDARDVRINPEGTAGWGRLGGLARYDTDGVWVVTISVDNLLDKRYRSHGSGLDAAGRNLAITIQRQWR